MQTRRLTSRQTDDIERTASRLALEGRDVLEADPSDLDLNESTTTPNDGCRLHVVMQLSDAARDRTPFIERLFDDVGMRLIETTEIGDYLGHVRSQATALPFDESSYGPAIDTPVTGTPNETQPMFDSGESQLESVTP